MSDYGAKYGALIRIEREDKGPLSSRLDWEGYEGERIRLTFDTPTHRTYLIYEHIPSALVLSKPDGHIDLEEVGRRIMVGRTPSKIISRPIWWIDDHKEGR